MIWTRGILRRCMLIKAARIQYDRKSLTCTQKLSDQLNLAHVARNNMKKKKLKQTNARANLVQYRFKIRGGSPEITENVK